MTLSNKNQGIIEADRRGYHCDEQGNIYNRHGNLVRGFYSCKKGYKAFSIRLNGKRINLPVHRFVAFQRYGDVILIEGSVVRHLNNDKGDNSWLNLAIGSHRENYMDLPQKVRVERARHAAILKHEKAAA